MKQLNIRAVLITLFSILFLSSNVVFCKNSKRGIDLTTQISALSSWTLLDSPQRLSRTFKFNFFTDVVTFVNNVKELIDQYHYCCSLTISEKEVTVELFSIDTLMVTEQDVLLAFAINEIPLPIISLPTPIACQQPAPCARLSLTNATQVLNTLSTQVITDLGNALRKKNMLLADEDIYALLASTEWALWSYQEKILSFKAQFIDTSDVFNLFNVLVDVFKKNRYYPSLYIACESIEIDCGQGNGKSMRQFDIDVAKEINTIFLRDFFNKLRCNDPNNPQFSYL